MYRNNILTYIVIFLFFFHFFSPFFSRYFFFSWLFLSIFFWGINDNLNKNLFSNYIYCFYLLILLMALYGPLIESWTKIITFFFFNAIGRFKSVFEIIQQFQLVVGFFLVSLRSATVAVIMSCVYIFLINIYLNQRGCPRVQK